MLVAAKYEEMYAPEIGDFVYITDNAYSEKQIRKMEIEVLTVLAYDLGRPLPLHFLRRNSKAGGVDALTHTLVSCFHFLGVFFPITDRNIWKRLFSVFEALWNWYVLVFTFP